MRRIVFVNRYFHPDHSATSQLLTDLAFHLAKSGWEVEVFTSRQLYDNPAAFLPALDVVNSVTIHRLWTTRNGRGSLFGRSIDYASFYLTTFLALLVHLHHKDIVVAETDPPLISVPAGMAARLKRAILVNWIQDVFPEVAEQLGVIKKRGVLASLLRGLRNRSLRAARINVVLGDLMAAKVQRRGAVAVVIPNWADGKTIVPIPTSLNELRKKLNIVSHFVVGYSGNLGRAHDYRPILGAIRQLQDESNVHFLMIGGGVRMDRLKQQVTSLQLQNVTFLPYQPRERLGMSLGAPDVHLISLNPSMEGLIVPSKYYGIAAAGRPAIFVGSHSGEIARIIERSGTGVTVETDDGSGLRQAILTMRDQPEETRMMGRQARQLFDEKYDVRHAFSLWSAMLEGQAQERAPRQTLVYDRRSWGVAFACFLAVALSLMILPWPSSVPESEWVPEATTIDRLPPAQLAARIGHDPSDWASSVALSEMALDLPDPNRKEIWKAAHAVTDGLVTGWPQAELPFVRGSFFHWGDLTPAERQLSIADAVVLLRDRDLFPLLYGPVWSVTRDIQLLARARPAGSDPARTVANLAVRFGQFDAYRQLRASIPEELTRELAALKAAKSTTDQLLKSLTTVAADANGDDDGVIHQYLELMTDDPPTGEFSEPSTIDATLRYILMRRLEPLRAMTGISEDHASPALLARVALRGGLVPRANQLERHAVAGNADADWATYFAERAAIEARGPNPSAARMLLAEITPALRSRPDVLEAELLVAMAEHDPAIADRTRETLARLYSPSSTADSPWLGLCGESQLCTAATKTVWSPGGDRVQIDLEPASPGSVGAYVEIFVRRERVAEGEVSGKRSFVVPVSAGSQLIGVRLMNPINLDGLPRRLALHSSPAS